MDIPKIPSAAQTAFQYVFAVENVLRELIIEALSAACGSRWYKSRLPGDVLARYREGLAYERRQNWTTFTPFHPIYYVEFPDLAKVIAQTNNWNEVFQPIFGQKSLITDALPTMEPIRNRVAHNRSVNAADLVHLASVSSKILNLLGANRFTQLLLRASAYQAIPISIENLSREIERTFQRIARFEAVASSPSFVAVESAWWFDSEFLNAEIGQIEQFLSLVKTYQSLPRGRGRGVEIERWVRDSGIRAVRSKASEQLRKLNDMSGKWFT